VSVDMLRIVCAVEEEARQSIENEKEIAKETIKLAHIAGEKQIESTVEMAKSEVDHLLRASHQKATADAKELASSNANKLATKRARAEKRLDSAAEFILERIVMSR